MIRVMHIVGARPNFMKIAPIMREMANHPDTFTQVLVHTGQHYDAKMSDVFFQQLQLPEPDVNLEVGSGSHAWQTAQVMMRFEPVLRDIRPDWVFVPGDVNSTLACALVSSKLGVRVAHVEAGLRSFDRTMPEEVNRVLTDQVSDILFATEQDAIDNLRNEGIPAQRVHLVGNVMIDTLVRLYPKAEGEWSGLRDRLMLDRYVLATFHRPSNVDDEDKLREVVSALNRVSADIPVVFPVHPRTRARMSTSGLKCSDHVVLAEPLGYLEFLALEAHAAAVLTDSGGIQEETTYLQVPCLTVRPNTERPVTLTEGTNRLVAGSGDAIVEAVQSVLQGEHDAGDRRVPALWDGRTAARIATIMRECDV